MMVTWPVVALVLGALATGGGSDTAKPRRETIEWCNIWVPDATSTDHPRVLLIGDSICVGYYGRVAKALEGRAYVAQLATSAAVGDSALLDQVRIVMSQYHFDVVHFNIGHHGMDYTETPTAARMCR